MSGYKDLASHLAPQSKCSINSSYSMAGMSRGQKGLNGKEGLRPRGEEQLNTGSYSSLGLCVCVHVLSRCRLCNPGL